MGQETDRRASSRPSTRFQPACIKIDGVAAIALMRDLTFDGAGFESDLDLSEGQPISYRWGSHDFRSGTVMWCSNGRFGVRNTGNAPSNFSDSDFPYRSVRVPTSLPVTVYANSSRHEGEILNVAHRGLCVLLAQKIARGSLASLKIGRHVLEGATFKWSEGAANGIALAQPLKLRDMSAIMRNAAA